MSMGEESDDRDSTSSKRASVALFDLPTAVSKYNVYIIYF
jgi:hypothetical protein